VGIALIGALAANAAACSDDSNGDAEANESTTTIVLTPQTNPVDIPEECPIIEPAAVEAFFGGKATQGQLNTEPEEQDDGITSCRITRDADQIVQSLVVSEVEGTATFDQALKVVPNAEPYTGLGDKAFVARNSISGATIVQWTKGDKTYSVTYNIGGFQGQQANPAQKHDQLMAMIQEAAATL
jgi:hypothetical protein